MPAETHSGGCQCGAIRYRISGPLGHAAFCHCRMCQKAFGSFGAPLVSVPAERITWTRGTPATFRSSSIVARGFCASCGTPLFMREDGHPDYDLAIGTLDEPSAAPPSEQVGIEGKVAWFETLANLPACRTEDKGTPEYMARLASFQHPDRDTDKWPPK
jgi:hypothetical protein